MVLSAEMYYCTKQRVFDKHSLYWVQETSSPFGSFPDEIDMYEIDMYEIWLIYEYTFITEVIKIGKKSNLHLTLYTYRPVTNSVRTQSTD